MNTIGERIIYLRDSKGMTQRKLMDELGITNLGRVEKNVGMPGVDMIISISNYFNVTTDWLLKGKEKDDNVNSHNCLQCQKYADLITTFNDLGDSEKVSIEKIMKALIVSNQIRNNVPIYWTEEDEINNNR